jgi:ribosome-associated translation inhibitor RaiA
MQTPVRITFQKMDASPALEAKIRDGVEELETVFDRIVSCRVSVEAPQRHQQGGIFKVHVELGVPGAQIVIGRSSHADASHADAFVAVRDAFRAARRQLEDYVDRRRGDVKAHSAP